MQAIREYKRLSKEIRDRGLAFSAFVLTMRHHEISEETVTLMASDLRAVKPTGAVTPYLKSVCRLDLLETYATIKSQLDFEIEEELLE